MIYDNCKHKTLDLYKEEDGLFQCKFCGIIFRLRDYQAMRLTQVTDGISKEKGIS